MKTIAIHQPNYFPWLGYFYKINSCDTFVVLDTVEYQYGNASSVTNRCKIKTGSGMQLLSVPVLKSSEEKLILNMKIDYKQNWQRKHLNAIQTNYGKSKFFHEIFPILNEIITNKYDSLSQLNSTAIKKICNYLNISTPIVFASDLNINQEDRNLRIIEICKNLNGTIYLSGNGGKKYNDESLYQQQHITLKYTTFVPPTYNQLYGDFLPNLSILDTLFNVGKDSVKHFF